MYAYYALTRVDRRGWLQYDTASVPTTGGCLDLAESQPSTDAPAVTALKRAGAVVLGKANMHELALEGISVSSLGGQTLNPYDHTRTPGGMTKWRCKGLPC